VFKFDRKNYYCGTWEMKIVEASLEFEYSPLEAAIFYGKYFWKDSKFFEILKKHNFLNSMDNLAKEFVHWAVTEMKDITVLECVLSLISKDPLYNCYDLQYGRLVHDPIHYAIRKKDLSKLKVCRYIYSTLDFGINVGVCLFIFEKI
jgi:hypothetical protein